MNLLLSVLLLSIIKSKLHQVLAASHATNKQNQTQHKNYRTEESHQQLNRMKLVVSMVVNA